MQAIRSGLQLKSAFKMIDKVGHGARRQAGFRVFTTNSAISRRARRMWGLGCGRGAMMHLPGLVLIEQVNQVIQAVNKVGLAVRGPVWRGDGGAGESLPDFQTRPRWARRKGKSSRGLNKVIEQIIQHEQNARQTLLQKKSP